MKTICEDSLQYFPSNSEIEELHSTYIANCVLNSFLSYIATVLNIATIHAIRKTASMPKTLKTLLLCLAFSDVGVGLLVLRFYISLLVGWLRHHSSCSSDEAFHIILYLFSVASFSGVVAVSVDRFLAIHLHLRYQELVTHKRVAALVISIWLLSVFLSLTLLFVPSDIVHVITIIFVIVGLVVITMVYVRIYIAVRRLKNQMQGLPLQLQDNTQTAVGLITSRCSEEEDGLERGAEIQPTQTGEIAHFATLLKSAFGTLHRGIPSVFSLLFTSLNLYGCHKNPRSKYFFKEIFSFLMTLVFLNSVLKNGKMRHVRYAFMIILRNMINWLRSRTSQK